MGIISTVEASTGRLALGEFLKLARCLAIGRGDLMIAAAHAKATNATARIVSILQRAATAPGTSSSWSEMLDYAVLSQAFSQSLRNIGVFDAALPYMIPAPLRSRGVKINTNITGSIVGEAVAKPIKRLDLSAANDLIAPRKSICIVITTKELLMLADPAADQLFNKELSSGVAAATDAKFLADLIAATTPIPSAGAGLANIMTDLRTLAKAINSNANSVLFFVTDPGNAKALVLSSSSTPAFPSAGPGGGELLPGLFLVPSDQLPAGTAVMFAADGIAANADVIALDSSENVTLELADPSTNPVTAAAVMTSLWQADMRALRAERYFGFSIVRPTAIASLSGVNY